MLEAVSNTLVTPSPAEIANDMAAHASYWNKRDRKIEQLCRDASALIRTMLDGTRPDGRTYHGVWKRLLDREQRYYQSRVRGYPNFGRARMCIERLKSGLN